MGQAIQKLRGKGDVEQKLLKQELDETISKYIEDNYKDLIEKDIEDLGGFYHTVYKIAEEITGASGSMQFKLPPAERLKKEYEQLQKLKKDGKLSKEEFKKLVQSVVTLDSFSIGEGAKRIFLYIFGVPVVAWLAKSVIPGPTKLIPDDYFIPAATTGTVVFLAKTNRL